MSPERTASGIAQLISQLCKADKLPAPWDPGQLISLIGSYTKLVGAIADQDQTQTDTGQQDLEEIMKSGKVGAYEAMCERARQREHAMNASKKTDKKS